MVEMRAIWLLMLFFVDRKNQDLSTFPLISTYLTEKQNLCKPQPGLPYLSPFYRLAFSRTHSKHFERR